MDEWHGSIMYFPTLQLILLDMEICQRSYFSQIAALMKTVTVTQPTGVLV